jgi:hypothetical protein
MLTPTLIQHWMRPAGADDAEEGITWLVRGFHTATDDTPARVHGPAQDRPVAGVCSGYIWVSSLPQSFQGLFTNERSDYLEEASATSVLLHLRKCTKSL